MFLCGLDYTITEIGGLSGSKFCHGVFFVDYFGEKLLFVKVLIEYSKMSQLDPVVFMSKPTKDVFLPSRARGLEGNEKTSDTAYCSETFSKY